MVLISFLNYQFEASFRMAFFGGLQAKKDTVKMKVCMLLYSTENAKRSCYRRRAIRATCYCQISSRITLLKRSKWRASTPRIVIWSPSCSLRSLTGTRCMRSRSKVSDLQLLNTLKPSGAGGLQFMRFLNEVMCDFDDLLERYDFSHVEKIKVSAKSQERRELRPTLNEKYALHISNLRAMHIV